MPLIFTSPAMSSVFTPPLDHSSPVIQQLHGLLVQAYPRWQKGAQLLSKHDQLGEADMQEIGSMHDNWFAVMNDLAARGLLRDVVQLASEDARAGGYSERFRDILEVSPEERPPAPSGEANQDFDRPWHSSESDEEIYFERLMNPESRLMDINLAQDILETSRSVAKLELAFGARRAYGTGFLIAPQLLLTNHHNVVHENYGNATSIRANFDFVWGFDGAPLQEAATVLHVNQEYDWAVLQLENPLPSSRPPIVLGEGREPEEGEMLIIIQHPLGGHKSFALQHQAVRYSDDRVIQYVADTQTGSSGSPVFNENMELVALHHAEVRRQVDWDDKHGEFWRNQGILIDPILEQIRALDDLRGYNIP